MPFRVRLRPIVCAAMVVAALLPAREGAAHAKLRSASPAQGAQLDRSPSEIRLSFTEAVEAGLSVITLRRQDGSWSVTLRTQHAMRDPRSCVAAVEPLRPGGYDVEWRAVSGDGHAMTGTYSFTVRGSEPQMPAAAPQPAAPAAPAVPAMRASRREMAARWLFIMGLAALVGAATASVGSFGGNVEGALAGTGLIVAFVGLALLADAQRRLAGATFAELLETSIGRALVWRAAAMAGAGIALAAARKRAIRRPAMLCVAVSALAAIGIHVAAGHAAAVERLPAAAIGLQWLHFAAAGVWLGGLAALLRGTRGEPDEMKTAAVHRYSTLAGIAIATVGLTGVLRAAQQVSSWNQLFSTDYGQAALAKAALLIAIGAVGALNRWHSVAAAATNLRPLRLFALIELALMIVVLGVAAILATLPPPG